ncbi:NmrA family transcriptional regulator [Microbispora corallina]|uniref:NmrA family transcriptional regulator n=1 Tax=Microbispora corallina TaxID=83302 RepID=A0ABQ4G468_9ACTN|nr:NmrA/HSCARG family protein [Microbispora corallina]GIH41778.1 NmrA family transcriptional regulator [Microbispora corallina]
MNETGGPVLVIGATGQQGGAAARHLLDRGRRVRALVRDAGAPAAAALREAGADLVTGDLDDAASLEAAMEGVHGVFLVLTMMEGPRITAAGVAAEERRGLLVADLAARLGVRHLVYSSLNGAGAGSGIPYYESKERIEDRIRALGVPATVLRPVSFMDNFATYNRPVMEDGRLVVGLAMPPDVPMPLIAVDDIGAFAALAFERPGRYLGRTVAIAGDVLTPPEIAEVLGRVRGVPALFRRVPIERVRAFDEQLAMMFAFFSEQPAQVPDVEALRADHPGLMTLETWARTRDLAEAGR